jgi:hypothetical protein
MGRCEDLTGQRFGMLQALRFAGHVKTGVHAFRAWLCRCDCGVEKVITVGRLRSKRDVSCGCWRRRKKKETDALRPPEDQGDGTYLIRLAGERDVAIVDAADLALVADYNWCLKEGHGRQYAHTRINDGTMVRWVRMHLLIMPGHPEIDHADGNGLNNRRGNLRPATHSDNLGNAKLHRDSSSGYKGVSLYRPGGTWRATIVQNYRQKCLGYHRSVLDAAKAYDLAAFQTFGEFARTNYPPEAYGLKPWGSAEAAVREIGR